MSFTQRKRAKIIANCYKTWDIQGKKALDVGCGNGVVSQVLKRELNIDVYGTDIIDYREADIAFKKMEDAHTLPFADLAFDYVMFNDMLHHSEEVESLLIEGVRVAKNIVIFEDQQSLLLNIVDIGLNYIYSSKMPCPLNFRTKEEWCALFDKLGFCFEIGEISSYPIWYPFRHLAFRLTKRRET